MRHTLLLGIFLFLIALSVPIILPYLHEGYFPTHDGEWAVVRLSEMFRSLKDGQFPVRYSGYLNFGYGYPLFNFTYPFPYYFGVLIHAVGFGFVDSIKIMFALSVALSMVGMFLLAKELWGKTSAGVLSAILYAYLPYRMVDLYARGSIGESLSFALYAFLLYFLIKAYRNQGRSFWVVLSSITLAIQITTHNIMAVFFLPILLGSLLVFVRKKGVSVLPRLVLVCVLGLGLSSFFWIPALAEKNTIVLSTIPIAQRSLYFVKPEQLLFGSSGYGTPTEENGFSYQLGLPHISSLLIVFVITFRFLIKKTKNIDEQILPVFVYGGLLLIFFFLLFSPSGIIWETLPFLSEINYPWTLLLPIGFLASLLAGYGARFGHVRYVLLALCMVAVVLYLPYAKPKEYVNRGDEFYLTNEATTTSSDELMPIWVKQKPSHRFADKVEVRQGQGEITDLLYNSKQVSFTADLRSQSLVRINTIYYPGWEVFVDNKKEKFFYENERGVMEVWIPSGKHSITAKFGETSLRVIANLISLFSVLSMFGLMVKVKKLRQFGRLGDH